MTPQFPLESVAADHKHIVMTPYFRVLIAKSVKTELHAQQMSYYVLKHTRFGPNGLRVLKPQQN